MIRHSPAMVQDLCRLHAQGLTVSEIAAQLHVGWDTARRWMRDLGLEPRQIEMVRLPPHKADHAVEMYRWGRGVSRIAEELGASHHAVRNELLARGITLRTKYAAGVATEAPTPKPEPVDTTTLAGRLIATKGKWAALSQIAAAQGWSSARAQQEYHRARASA
jgi:transposase-like protein